MYHDKDTDPRPKFRKFPLVSPAALPPMNSITAYQSQPHGTLPKANASSGETALLLVAILIIILAFLNRYGGFFFCWRYI